MTESRMIDLSNLSGLEVVLLIADEQALDTLVSTQQIRGVKRIAQGKRGITITATLMKVGIADLRANPCIKRYDLNNYNKPGASN